MSSPFGVSTQGPAPAVEEIKLWPKQVAWSYSVVNAHARCPRQFRFRRVEKRYEPESDALSRGIAAHGAVAEYLRCGEWPADSPVDARWGAVLDTLRPMKPRTEMQVAFDREWNAVEWFGKTVWLRVVLDAMYWDGDEGGIVNVYEWKTGRYYDEHEQQKRLYALAALLAAPRAQLAQVYMGYLDKKPELSKPTTFARLSIDELKREFTEFSREFLNDDIYPARPNRFCGWCHWRATNGGPCEHG